MATPAPQPPAHRPDPRPVAPTTTTVRVYKQAPVGSPKGTKPSPAGSLEVPLGGKQESDDAVRTTVVAAVAKYIGCTPQQVQISHAVGGGFVAYVAPKRG